MKNLISKVIWSLTNKWKYCTISEQDLISCLLRTILWSQKNRDLKLCLITNKAPYFHLSILQTQCNTKQNAFIPVLNLNTIRQKFHCSVPLQLLNGFIDYRSYNSLASIQSSYNSKLFGLESWSVSPETKYVWMDKILKGSISSQSSFISDLSSCR